MDRALPRSTDQNGRPGAVPFSRLTMHGGLVGTRNALNRYTIAIFSIPLDCVDTHAEFTRSVQ
jgi:hypothetical protein